ncbi:PHD finger protein 11 isoform X2 [Hemicordylus capensis]|uniref:PHD finger protein 11 isoform X2 n=1 Tax=Hemicordylus capensis TaxID=884348 RepID=UPI0023042EDD|nr:PHD finger protein 11 isoform X2 [Hemicordylus capensis]
MEKMVRRQCAFCPEDEECAIMYIAEGKNLAVHQDCLLYSSGFVESEEHNPDNLNIRFDVTSVVNEIKRGKRLMCSFCRKKGATVGCEIKNCRRSYHYFCALCDDAAVETDEMQGIYRVFCPNHDPFKKTSLYDEDSKRERPSIVMKPSSTRKKMSDMETVAEETLEFLKKKHDRHKEYEETVISLFDCGLFENILTTAHSGIEEKKQALLANRNRLDSQIERLKDLQEVVLPTPEDTASTSHCVAESPASTLYDSSCPVLA